MLSKQQDCLCAQILIVMKFKVVSGRKYLASFLLNVQVLLSFWLLWVVLYCRTDDSSVLDVVKQVTQLHAGRGLPVDRVIRFSGRRKKIRNTAEVSRFIIE